MTRDPVQIKPTAEEVRRGRLANQNIERALYALHFDGLVVLENVVDHAHLDILNAAMVKDAEYLQSLGDAGPFNYHKGQTLHG